MIYIYKNSINKKINGQMDGYKMYKLIWMDRYRQKDEQIEV